MHCNTCDYWKNKQAELDYNRFRGICTCHKWQFDINNDSDVALLDRCNPSEKFNRIQRFESQKAVVPFGEVVKSRYCLVTSDMFGCIHHKSKKENHNVKRNSK